MTRVMLVIFTVATGGATYATVTGTGAQSTEISQSIRSGSAGRGMLRNHRQADAILFARRAGR